MATSRASFPKNVVFPQATYTAPSLPLRSANSLILFAWPLDLDEVNFPKNEWLRFLQENWISIFIARPFPLKHEPAMLLVTLIQ